MSDVEITIIQTQLASMAADPDIQREIAEIESEFSITEMDRFSETLHPRFASSIRELSSSNPVVRRLP